MSMFRTRLNRLCSTAATASTASRSTAAADHETRDTCFRESPYGTALSPMRGAFFVIDSESCTRSDVHCGLLSSSALDRELNDVVGVVVDGAALGEYPVQVGAPLPHRHAL